MQLQSHHPVRHGDCYCLLPLSLLRWTCPLCSTCASLRMRRCDVDLISCRAYAFAFFSCSLMTLRQMPATPGTLRTTIPWDFPVAFPCHVRPTQAHLAHRSNLICPLHETASLADQLVLQADQRLVSKISFSPAYSWHRLPCYAVCLPAIRILSTPEIYSVRPRTQTSPGRVDGK